MGSVPTTFAFPDKFACAAGRRWDFLFRWQGKPTEIGLGSARDVTRARARELASQAQQPKGSWKAHRRRHVR
jgi:hypothetical protein